METLIFARLDGSTIQHERARAESALSGDLLFPNSKDFDEARSIWNAMIDRRPALVVRPRTENDVVAAVDFAKENDLAIAVKGGGHNIAGKAMMDNGIVVDFHHMKKITVDPERRIAKVQPGATLGDVDAATQPHGLAVPVGINSTTGIAGLTLGGGFGWTTRKYGLTIDNLRSVRLITAAGQKLTVDAASHPDLFWAVRGGGGNFGVVTEFEFDLKPVGPQVLAGMVVHPFADMRDVVTQYQAALDRAPDDISCWVILRKAPPLPFLPEEWHGREVVVLAMCNIGDLANAEETAAPFRDIGDPIVDMVEPMPFLDWQAAFDPLLTPGARNYWKSHDVASFSDEALQIIADAISELPTDECEVFFGHVGGAMTRVPTSATAWPNREPHFAVNVHTRWQDAGDDDRCRQWARTLHRRLEPYAMGSMYVNFIPEGDEERIADIYGSNFERLRALKGAVDPDNLFRANQNIAPERSE